ncbi:hypothetical protein CVT24_007069 [Panaeolus cyanescens]|uniref:DUF6699 domain-containing protein n=1 Tax=Panaeolus cyanescens TaxID=181874 RepID=A0A409VJU2_9AGAR|nr:hypothetical protein CVT24_007069 [Panaeolus cyanescens]
MTSRAKPKRVSFSASDQIIAAPSPTASSGSEPDPEELAHRMKHLGLDAAAHESHTKPPHYGPASDKRSSPSRGSVPVPPTPVLKPRELPADDASQSRALSARSSHASSSSPGSTASSLSPHHASPSTHLPPSSSAHAISTAKRTNSPPSKPKNSIAEEEEVALILSTRLTSGDPWGWDLTIDPLTQGIRVSRMIQKEGHLPAAFSVRSQGPYRGQVKIKHHALPWSLVIRPREGAECVTVHDVLDALYVFLHKRVSDADLAAEGKQRQSQIVQTAMDRTRRSTPEVRRIDWLSGSTMFSGLSLGKDGETVILLTSPSRRSS